MKRTTILVIGCLALILSSCDQNSSANKTVSGKTDEKVQHLSILGKVDKLDKVVKKNTENYQWKISLDHHRMAEEEGAYTPPAIASIFSNSEINSIILSSTQQLVGLDLPYKVLCYSEADTADAKVAFTSADFIAKRHRISNAVLGDYTKQMNAILDHFDQSLISKTNVDSVNFGFGIVKLQSDFNFQETVIKLVNIVHAQSDTRWFGDIDYQIEAKEFGVNLNPTKLLLFGGPAPGAKAMMTSPKIGLDAFCQKLLVYENEKAEVWIAFNDIVAFSKLYYGRTTKPQQVINQRLIQTFSKAIKKIQD